jgi:hypothetical protein
VGYKYLRVSVLNIKLSVPLCLGGEKRVLLTSPYPLISLVHDIADNINDKRTVV